MDDVSPLPSSDDENMAQENMKSRLRLLEKARLAKKQKRDRAMVSILGTISHYRTIIKCTPFARRRSYRLLDQVSQLTRLAMQIDGYSCMITFIIAGE